MSEEQPEGQDPPGEDEAGEGEAGEAEAPEAEAPEAEAPEAEAAEGEVAASGAEEGENEAEATTGEEAADAQETKEQEPAGSDEPSPVEYTEIEVQTDFTFSPSASNTDIARQLLETLEEEDGTEEPAEGEEGAEKEAAEGEGGEGEGGEGEGGEEAESEQQEETEIDDWIKETKGKKPKESRAMWDYSLYAPISMVQEQIVETYEDLVLPMITKLCQPMWDYDLLASASMIQSQVDESYELKLELTSLRCEPMWDYDLSVPPEVAQAQVFVEEKELKYEISSLKCYPMWDYDLNAPIQAIPEEIYWVPSYLNFVGVTRQKFFHIEETPNTKFIQTDLHFDPESIIQPEDLLKEPNEEEEEKRRCYTDPNYVPDEISDIIDDDGAAYPNYFELQKPYKIVGDHCVTEEEEGGGGEEEEEESESARAERGSESEETAEEVTSTEVQTDVGLGELLQSESISSVPEPGDEAEEQAAVGDAEESAPAAEGAEGDETSKGEPDVPWALLSDTAVAPQQFLITTEDDILSTVSLAPTADRQENKFNFAVTLGGSVWGFPEYSTEEEEPGSGTVLPQNGDEFTWVPDSSTPFESSVFTPISEEDALLLESVHADEPLEPAKTEETDELTLITEDREVSTSGGPIIEVEITMPSTFGENSTENVPQIEVGVAWEALPESLADGRTPDIIVKTVVEDTKK